MRNEARREYGGRSMEHPGMRVESRGEFCHTDRSRESTFGTAGALPNDPEGSKQCLRFPPRPSNFRSLLVRSCPRETLTMLPASEFSWRRTNMYLHFDVESTNRNDSNRLWHDLRPTYTDLSNFTNIFSKVLYHELKLNAGVFTRLSFVRSTK